MLACAGEQVALGHQHAGEKHQQQDLGELCRLNTEAGQADQIFAPLVSESFVGSTAGMANSTSPVTPKM